MHVLRPSILRDAAKRAAPQDEVGDIFTLSQDEVALPAVQATINM